MKTLLSIFISLVRATDEIPVCANAGNQFLNKSSGVVESEHPYPPNVYCKYEINPGTTKPIRIKFTKVKFKILIEEFYTGRTTVYRF